MISDQHFGTHPQPQIIRIAFRHLGLDFECRQVNHCHYKLVAIHRGLLIHHQVADDSVDRRAHSQFIDLAQ